MGFAWFYAERGLSGLFCLFLKKVYDEEVHKRSAAKTDSNRDSKEIYTFLKILGA